jgi:hypothetical protein
MRNGSGPGGALTIVVTTTQHHAESSHSGPLVLSACCNEGSTAVSCGTPRYKPDAGQPHSPGTVDRFPSSRRGFDSRHPLHCKGAVHAFLDWGFIASVRK